jgi:hypothetical protein
MHRPNRRELLKTTGVGAGVALGMGTGSAQSTASQTVQTAQSREAEKVFTATADSGFIVVNGDSASDGPIQFGGNSIDGDVSIEGVVYSDDTWESTRVNFPKLQPEDVLDDDDIPVVSPEDLDGDIDIQVDPITGTYNIDKEIVTGDFALTIDVDLSAAGIVSFDVEVSADAVLTTEQSGDMNGDVQGGLGDGTATVTLVNNEFDLPASGNDTIDDQLGLPSPSGRNYLEIALNLEITDIEDQPDQPQPLTSFQTTNADGFIIFNSDTKREKGSDKRFEFGGGNVDGDIQINGQVYDDATWKVTNLNVPEIDLESIIISEAKDLLPDWLDWSVDLLDVSVDIQVDEENFGGRYDPQADLVTGTLDVTIDANASLAIIGTIVDFVIDVDPAELTTKESNGAATPEGMQGEVMQPLDSETPEVKLVAQEFNVPASEGGGTVGDFIVDSVIGTPSQAGRNWAQFDLELDLDDPSALEGEIVFDPVVDNPPQDLNGDGLFEDVLGSGTFNEFDPEALFDNLDSDAVQGQSDIFAFAGGLDRTQIGAVDVQALYNAYEETQGNVDQFPAPPDVIVPGGEVDLSLRPETSQIAEGETVQVDVVVEGADTGIEAFDLSVSLTDSAVASITDFEHGKSVEKDDSAIVEEGGRIDLRGATLEEPFQSSEEITLTTLDVTAEKPGSATTLEFEVGSFPQGLFGDSTDQYQVASSPPETVTIDFAEEVEMVSQKSRGGDTVTVTIANPGNSGAYVGIWRTDGDGTPTQLLGTSEMGSAESGSEIVVTLDEKLSDSETLAAAIHPAGEGGPETAQILASASAAVEVAPPKLAPGLPGPPKDLDGDGLYEAVRGNNEVSILDVQTLFNRLDDPTLQENARFFKFQEGGSDEVTILDVQALFNRIDS